MINENYFIGDDENGFGRCFVLTGEWRDQFSNIMIANDISVLRLSESAGWKGADISFLLELDFLQGIEIYSSKIHDVSLLEKNNNILFLGLQCDLKKAVDFSVFEKMQICKIFWNAKIKDLFKCEALQHLNIINYPGVDFSEIELLRNLNRLQLSSNKLISIDGIGSLNELQIIDLFNCGKLQDVSDLTKVISLREIEMDRCKNINSFPESLELVNLVSVRLNDCGDISSLKPFFSCPKLKKLHAVGNTNIVDGDFDIFLNHPSLVDIWYGNKKHYSISREILMQRLSLNKS